MIRTIAAGLMLLLTALPTHAGTLSWDARALSYVHDMEFFQDAGDHQEGRTYFGQQVAVYGTARPAPDVLIGVGVLVDIQFGRDRDENWDASEPYVFLETELGDGVLRFGNLDRSRQVLHQALIAPDLRYERPADRGMAFRRGGDRLDANCWIQWRLQERLDRREVFDVGGRARWRVHAGETQALTLAADWHVYHKGGQLSSVGRLEESWGLLAGPTWRLDLGRGDWSGELSAVAGATADRRFRHDGRGGEVRAARQRGGFQLAVARWWGDEWLTEDGRPLYTYDALTSWGASYRWRPGGLIDADLGFRLHHVGDDTESEFWFLLDLASLNPDGAAE